ncbi:uncharacterized protein EDB91DRAFT_1109737 [Suillus paluster]|uniref:uncharacterized protein n=1 Tax=Suillus paluster TaxID=48578 RepID=UPI001B8702A4|nr:uncharacterized protein EDB91DRAFT_1109737 [Suillus paluster]KAG1749803.1 hypothetical protein EDB91DRAFT_1109737 [Suillus paluster]
MALNWGRSLCQPSYQIQVSPSTVHDERVLGFYTSASAAATHPQYYNPDPYARVSPASFTRDFDQSPSSYYHGDSPPNFSRPLSMSVLNDPAFSSDPRLHPHFPLVSPTFFKELPSKSPVMLVRNLPHTPPYTHSHLSPHQEFIYPIDRSDFSHSSDSEEEHPSPTISTSPCIPPTSVRPIPKRHVSAPEQREKVAKPPTVRFNTAPVHADGSNRPTGKRNMKNFMRRFTTSRSLDRIDELDETDPFGAGWHHGGPYEAIGSNLAQLGPAHKYNDIDILRGDLYSKSKRENVPRPVRTQKSPRVPQVGVGGQSLNIVPGQIFHQSPIGDTISSPQANTVNPNADLRNPGSGQVEPSHSRSHSTPLYHPIKPPEGPPSDTSLHVPASRFPPRIHHFGVDIPHLPQHPRPAHDELASYPLYQIHSAPVLAPDPNKRYPETMSPSRGDANFRTLVSSPPIVEPPNGQGNHLAPDLPRHRSTHSLDSSRTRTTTATQSTSRTQNSLQPPRTNRHLPKRLVMPAPLQPQQPLPQQQQLNLYPQADYYDPYADPDLFPPTKGHAHEPAAMYHQGRKLLRKKTAVFPGNVPLPTHAPVVNVDAIPPLTKHPSLSIAEAGKVKERVHRRRLSKRKHDV